MAEWTEEQKANNNFFGNAVSIDMQLDEIKVFLHQVYNFIKVTHSKLQSNKIKDLDDETLYELKYHFQHTQGEILLKSIMGLYEIRNSIVHNIGLIADFGKRKTIENFVNRNMSFTIDDNEKIIISHQACVDSIKIIENFFDELTNFALRTFPKRK